MNLLVVNFEMNPESQVLSWQYRVVAELARHCANVAVATEMLGCSAPAPNVRLHELPRMLRRFPLRVLGGRMLLNLPVYCWCRRHRIDACFIHMSQEWAYRLHPCFRRLRIPVMLWYAHGTVAPDLARALACVDRVVTSTPEGFRIPSPKVKIIGQAIDTTVFDLPPGVPGSGIITVSRISRKKRFDLMLRSFAELVRLHPEVPFRFDLVGAPITADDVAYERELRQLVETTGLAGRVTFCGHLSQAGVAARYAGTFIHLNLSQTGSMDKTVMEALAAGCPVLTSNEAFFDELRAFPDFLITADEPAPVAARLWRIYEQRAAIDRTQLRARIVGRHDLPGYVRKLVGQLEDLVLAGRGP